MLCTQENRQNALSRSLPEKDLACTPISGTNLYLCPTEGGLCFRNSRWRQKSPTFEFKKPLMLFTSPLPVADHSGKFYFMSRKSLALVGEDAKKYRYRLLRAHPYLAI
ncbi:hypothetical protein FOZ60_016354 [Perkinsus olseni]|uniref:Uncharacterized protein n=1 Tax=Perkinsus olseni TaxID=32597 RepID=A0A7J6N521_PEROL|nr:hypothetical protein FOZ60_016354 [Perkinsus olseni]